MRKKWKEKKLIFVSNRWSFFPFSSLFLFKHLIIFSFHPTIPLNAAFILWNWNRGDDATPYADDVNPFRRRHSRPQTYATSVFYSQIAAAIPATANLWRESLLHRGGTGFCSGRDFFLNHFPVEPRNRPGWTGHTGLIAWPIQCPARLGPDFKNYG